MHEDTKRALTRTEALLRQQAARIRELEAKLATSVPVTELELMQNGTPESIADLVRSRRSK